MAGFNFNLNNVLREAAEEDAYVLDNSLSAELDSLEMQKMFDDVDIVDDAVEDAIKEQASDPRNLRIVYNSGNFYLDYTEMINYCEATGYSVRRAFDSIIDEYSSEYSTLNEDTLKLVIPTLDDFKKAKKQLQGYGDGLGVTDLLWSSRFIHNCLNNGIGCVTFK